MPKYWKSKTILAKIETTYGTDPNPTGAANAILAMDVTFKPMQGQVIQRNIETTYFGAKPFVVQGIYSQISFSVDLVGSGTAGTAPAWGPLLRACKAAEVITAGTKVEYTPITDNPESVGLYFDVDGIKQVMLGCRGTAVFTVDINGNPRIQFTLSGLFAPASDAVKPTPNYSAWKAPQAVSMANTPTFTIGGTSFVMRSFELDLAVQVEPRMLVGFEGILDTNCDERLKVTVEAVAMATYNPTQVARDGTPKAIQLVHGTASGKIVTFDVPSAQQLPIEDYQEQQGILEWPLTFVPLPTAGNDQWKITLT